MTVDSGGSRVEAIEAEILKIRGVDHVAVVAGPDGAIREIYVVTRSEKPARLLVRDIQGLVLTKFGKSIDRRVVSISSLRSNKDGSDGGPRAAEHDAGLASPAKSAPPIEGSPSTRAADRIRFDSVNLYVSGPRAQAQVSLRWKGITRMGSASGTATRDGAHLLVAAATVAALEEFLEEDWSLGVNAVQFVKLGVSEVAVVGLTLLAHRREKSLAGCCTVEQDVPQAVALATLAALNRVVGGLETREPIEYVLRPTSFTEASEARKT
jgi:hypothetical protein